MVARKDSQHEVHEYTDNNNGHRLEDREKEYTQANKKKKNTEK